MSTSSMDRTVRWTLSAELADVSSDPDDEVG